VLEAVVANVRSDLETPCVSASIMAAAGTPVVCLDDIEQYARRVLTKNAFDYYRSGADDQITLKDNVDAFRRSVYVLLSRGIVL
jgi:hypothetical protein